MKSHKWCTLAFLSVTLISIVLAVLSIIVSEIVFYAQNKYWFFRPVRSASSVKERNDFSLYREPFSIPRQKDRIRILAMGGSTTYGLGLDLSATWPKLLSARLNKHFPNRYEVINLGRLGGHLEEFIQNYHRSSTVYIPRDKWSNGDRPGTKDFADWGWKDLNPDIIILVPIVNDTAPDYIYFSEPNIIAKAAHKVLSAGGKPFLFNKLALGFYFKKLLTILELKNRRQTTDLSVRLNKIRSDYTKNLVDFIQLWDTQTRIYLIGLPLLFNKEDGEKQVRQAALYWNISDTSSLLQEVHYIPVLEDLEKSVRLEVAQEKKIYYREVGKNIKAQSFSKRLRLYIDSAHMNTSGVKIISDEIFEFIINN